MTALTIFQGAVFISYLTFITIKFGILQSISDSWYKLQALGGVWYSLFTWFCVLLGFSMFFQSNGTYFPMFFLSGLGLVMVGVATQFKALNEYTPIIHFSGAIMAIGFGLIGVCMEHNTALPSILFSIVAVMLFTFKVKNLMLWVEIAGFAAIFWGLQ